MCCPDDALSIGYLGQVILSPTLCTLCGACEKACPIGAIEIFDDLVYVCDLCGGRPQCVEVCTEGAITYGAESGEHPPLAVYNKETNKMNPSQKRNFYIERQGYEVRKKWRKQYA